MARLFNHVLGHMQRYCYCCCYSYSHYSYSYSYSHLFRCYQICDAAVESNVDVLVLCDTNGGCLPWEVSSCLDDSLIYSAQLVCHAEITGSRGLFLCRDWGSCDFYLFIILLFILRWMGKNEA